MNLRTLARERGGLQRELFGELAPEPEVEDAEHLASPRARSTPAPAPSAPEAPGDGEAALLDLFGEAPARALDLAPPYDLPALPLRPYQHDCVRDVLAWLQAGGRRGIIALPTGTGKTCVGLALARRLGRTLWLAHREELCTQPLARVRDAWPDVSAGLEKADAREGARARDLVVASVQTVQQRTEDGRMPRLDPLGSFDCVVVDEAHHAASPTYRRVLERLGCFALQGPPVLGLTATVERSDGVGLETVFERVVHQLALLEAIREGYLAPFAPPVVERVHGLEIPEGADDAEIDAAIDANLETVVMATADVWRRHGQGRKTLIFTARVVQAQKTAAELAARGVRAAWLSGETPDDERRETLRRFAAGELEVLANAALLIEGYDEPTVSCVVIARPTTSKSLYLQMLGRATRLAPGKDDWLAIDLAGASEVHSLVQAPVLLGLVPAKDDHDGASEAGGGEDEGGARRLDPTSGLRRGPQHREPVRWVDVYEGREVYAAAGGGGSTVLVHLREGRWLVELAPRTGPKEAVGRYSDRDLALGVGADTVRRTGGQGYAHPDADWRRRRASPKSVRAAIRWRQPVREGATAGEVSDLILRGIARSRVRR